MLKPKYKLNGGPVFTFIACHGGRLTPLSSHQLPHLSEGHSSAGAPFVVRAPPLTMCGGLFGVSLIVTCRIFLPAHPTKPDDAPVQESLLCTNIKNSGLAQWNMCVKNYVDCDENSRNANIFTMT